MSTYIVHKKRGVVSETPKPIIAPMVHYVYIHSSQDEGVVTETPKAIITQ